VQTLRGIRIGENAAAEVGIPIHFHTHEPAASRASVLKAAEAGVDVADELSPHERGTSQPNSIHRRSAPPHAGDTQLDVDTLNECSDYWERSHYYLPFDSGPKAGSARLYQHEIPGGQYTNLREQAAAWASVIAGAKPKKCTRR